MRSTKRGRLRFGDSLLSGSWVDGVLQGAVTIDYDDGRSFECRYVDGELDLSSTVSERDEKRRLTFHGHMLDDESTCGTRYDHNCGTQTIGTHVRNELCDDAGVFVYPDGSRLVGRFVDGLAVRVLFVDALGRKHVDATYASDVSTTTTLARWPMRAEPYETAHVYVAPSTERGGGDGLFARRPLPPRTVVAFYNGVRLTHVAERARSWQLNANTISLNDTHVLDIPAPFDCARRYTAALGHKVNTALTRRGDVDQTRVNVMYDAMFHPLLGDINTIKTLRAIDVDEELFVDYGYDDDDPLLLHMQRVARGNDDNVDNDDGAKRRRRK